MSVAYLYSSELVPTVVPRFYFSEIRDAPERPRRWGFGLKTPNGQMITRVELPGRRLYVYTRSRVYYFRRGKLRLWRVL